VITEEIDIVKTVLEKNNLAAIPTETVYGLAANAFSASAVKKIFDLKKRPSYNPLIVHIKNLDYLNELATNVPSAALKLAEEFWPGPLTLVLEKKELVPDITTAGKGTVAVRIPNHPLTLELLNQLDFPLAAPSANPFGSISPTSAEHVFKYFGKNLEAILDGGHCRKGIESTIIGFEDGEPILFRLGSIPAESIEEVTGVLKIKNLDDKTPSAPGMLSRHYAPETDTFLTENVEELISRFSEKRIGLITLTESKYSKRVEQAEVLSKTADLVEATANLYAAMHRLDQLKLDVIIAEKMPKKGLGNSINDRLSRAIKK